MHVHDQPRRAGRTGARRRSRGSWSRPPNEEASEGDRRAGRGRPAMVQERHRVLRSCRAARRPGRLRADRVPLRLWTVGGDSRRRRAGRPTGREIARPRTSTAVVGVGPSDSRSAAAAPSPPGAADGGSSCSRSRRPRRGSRAPARAPAAAAARSGLPASGWPAVAGTTTWMLDVGRGRGVELGLVAGRGRRPPSPTTFLVMSCAACGARARPLDEDERPRLEQLRVGAAVVDLVAGGASRE